MIRKLKINKDIYYNTLDFFKKRIVEVCGLILISIFGVFSYSLINYSPKNETLIYKIDEEVTGVCSKFTQICQLIFSSIIWSYIVFNCIKYFVMGDQFNI